MESTPLITTQRGTLTHQHRFCQHGKKHRRGRIITRFRPNTFNMVTRTVRMISGLFTSVRQTNTRIGGNLFPNLRAVNNNRNVIGHRRLPACGRIMGQKKFWTQNPRVGVVKIIHGLIFTVGGDNRAPRRTQLFGNLFRGLLSFLRHETEFGSTQATQFQPKYT